MVDFKQSIFSTSDESTIHCGDQVNDQGDMSTLDGVKGGLFWALNAGNLALKGAGGATRVAGELHHTITNPFPVNVEQEDRLSKAPLPYRIVHDTLYAISDFTPWHHLEAASNPSLLHQIKSWTNGVIGDKLEKWRHPLTTSMKIVDKNGRDLSLEDRYEKSSRGVLLFLHGLCLSEYEWQNDSNAKFVKAMKDQGYDVAWLRYNTGLPVWENAMLLSSLLQSEIGRQPDGKTLMMVGHSMGGLLIRGACYHSSKHSGYSWHRQLSHAAYLATPHYGAPLERLGHTATSHLEKVPYLKPFSALGNIRSLGIQSLRQGFVANPHSHESALSEKQSYLTHTKHFLLAASLDNFSKNTVIGDGLVPVHSALAEDSTFLSENNAITRLHLDELGHIKLLQDSRVYQGLLDWIQPSS